VSFTTFYLKSGKKLKKVVFSAFLSQNMKKIEKKWFFSAFLCPNMKKTENSSFFCIFMSKHEENRK